MSDYPEGQSPLTWQDMDFALPKGHPSTFELECKQLRARVAELEGVLRRIIDLDDRAHSEQEASEGLDEAATLASNALGESEG